MGVLVVVVVEVVGVVLVVDGVVVVVVVVGVIVVVVVGAKKVVIGIFIKNCLFSLKYNQHMNEIYFSESLVTFTRSTRIG